jgi:hypothetical protein
MPKLTASIPVDLPDGRKVRVQSYDDGSIRLRVQDDSPYMIAEAFLTGGKGKHTIIKLVPAGPT